MINKQKQSGPEVPKPSTIFNPLCRTSSTEQKGVAWKLSDILLILNIHQRGGLWIANNCERAHSNMNWGFFFDAKMWTPAQSLKKGPTYRAVSDTNGATSSYANVIYFKWQ